MRPKGLDGSRDNADAMFDDIAFAVLDDVAVRHEDSVVFSQFLDCEDGYLSWNWSIQVEVAMLVLFDRGTA